MSKRKSNRVVSSGNTASTATFGNTATATTAVTGAKEPTVATRTGVVVVLVAALLLFLLTIGIKATMLSGSDGSVALASDAADGLAQTDTTAGAPMPLISQESLSQATPKEEMVYAVLQSDGKPYLGYAINHYSSSAEREIVDFGSYTSLKNLTSTSAINAENGRISTTVGPGDFYYQGALQGIELPWQVDVRWQLDGIEMAAQDIVGKSGNLEIHFSVNPNPAADPVYFENYLLQTQIVMSSEVAKNIEVSNGSTATVGKNEQSIFIVMPNRSGEFWLKASVSNFEMMGIQFLGLPFSTYFDMPDTSGIVTNMIDLAAAIDNLDQSINTIVEGSAQLASGGEALGSGSAKINESIAQLSGSGVLLSASSVEIDKSLLSISEQLSAGTSSPQSSAELAAGLRSLAKALNSSDPMVPGMTQSLQNIANGLGDATATLEQAIGALQVVPAAQVEALNADLGMGYLRPDSQMTVGALVALNAQATYLKAVWTGTPQNPGIATALGTAQSGLSTNVIPACQSMSGQLETMATSLETGASSMNDLVVLSSYLQQLSTEYSSFNSSLTKYSQSMEELSGSYKSIDAGISEHTNNSSELNEGLQQLQDGSNELDNTAEGMPKTTQEQIDAAYAEYQPQPFELKSFVCPQNKAVQKVQFVMLSDALQLPDVAIEDSEEESPGFWSRLGALFGM